MQSFMITQKQCFMLIVKYKVILLLLLLLLGFTTEMTVENKEKKTVCVDGLEALSQQPKQKNKTEEITHTHKNTIIW